MEKESINPPTIKEQDFSKTKKREKKKATKEVKCKRKRREERPTESEARSLPLLAFFPFFEKEKHP